MVSIEKVQRGIAAYMEQEIIARLPEGSLGKAAAKGAKFVFLARSKQALDTLAQNPVAKVFGLADTGELDVDMACDAAKEAIGDSGLTVTLPVLGSLTFYPADVDTLKRMIVSA